MDSAELHEYVMRGSRPSSLLFVVFPDAGAHWRFYTMVVNRLRIEPSQVLFLKKTRVGGAIDQEVQLYYCPEEQPDRTRRAGAATKREDPLPADACVLIADDFTNSGSTLFGAAKIVRARAVAGASMRVGAWVTHFVAQYDEEKVKTFVAALYDEGSQLDYFCCSDSVPSATAWLREHERLYLAGRPLERRVHVRPLAPVLAEWVVMVQDPARQGSLAERRKEKEQRRIRREERLTIVCSEGMEDMARGVDEELRRDRDDASRSRIGVVPTDSDVVVWERFPSGDPNIRLRVKELHDRHVVLIMNMDNLSGFFEQLALLLQLPSFRVPHEREKYATEKWKGIPPSGYSACSVRSLTVIIPWNRFGQMERTCRWTVDPTATSTNGWSCIQSDGPYVDVPTLLSHAAMLSSSTHGGSVVPRHLLFIDIHEYEQLEIALNATEIWANRKCAYNLRKGSGTYYESHFRTFLEALKDPTEGQLRVEVANNDVQQLYVLFPDDGAHRRFYVMVTTLLEGLSYEHVLFIDQGQLKSRNAHGHTAPGPERLPADACVLIADDFTNSGTTLFGAAKIVHDHAEQGHRLRVTAHVTHFIAQYDQEVVREFVDKVYAPNSPLHGFYCSDSVPRVIKWLREAVDQRVQAGVGQRVHVRPLAPLVARWIRGLNHTEQRRLPSSSGASAFKFSCDFQLDYGDLTDFHKGLEACIGQPSKNPRGMMQMEHCYSKDSWLAFRTSNYDIMTIPYVEWLFVWDVEQGATLLQTGTEDNTHNTLPPEIPLSDDACWKLRFPGGKDRTLRTRKALSDVMFHKNQRLDELKAEKLIEIEVIGACLVRVHAVDALLPRTACAAPTLRVPRPWVERVPRPHCVCRAHA